MDRGGRPVLKPEPVPGTAPDSGGGLAAGTRGFSFGGKTLLSGVNPEGAAERVAETVEITNRTLYLCPSPLYGYGLGRLLARLAETADSAVLCVEAEPELFALSLKSFGAALKTGDGLLLTDRVDAGELCALVRRKWGSRAFAAVRTVRLNGGWQLHRELYDALARTLQREVALDWGNAITLTKLGRRYVRNAFRNLALIPRARSLDDAAGALSFGDKPVLVLGAGPSLDGTLDAFSAGFGRAPFCPETRPFRVVCVDTCLPALKARGIRPDLAVVLESQHWNLEDFVGLSGWEVPAAMDVSALPRSGGVLAGGLFLFFTPWTRLRVFERLRAGGLLPRAVPPLGSVGLSAVAAALRLTRGAVVAAGLDFSFGPDLFHARSSPGHAAALRRQNRFTGLFNAGAFFDGTVSAAVSKTGGRVFSNHALKKYRDLFEREFAAVSGNVPGGRLFDVADGGLPLGLKTLSSAQAVELLSGGGSAGDTARGETAASGSPPPVEKLKAFALDEQNRLSSLRDMLAGKTKGDRETLETLIDECDYLWAHFPDYAAAGRRPSGAELEAGTPKAVSFLKRLRVEIDPFLALLARL